MMADEAEAQGLKPIALIHGYDQSAQEPEWFTTAPVSAINKTLARVGWTVDDVDVWEVNEAFAVVAMAAMKELNIDHDRLNVNGGACGVRDFYKNFYRNYCVIFPKLRIPQNSFKTN